ncbi:hypothetical protein Patl1_14617 [Pistacia atlantica]|uniref:Uncharacterized protein n=1 Tax=Pistacia atlantica TaxID=434234 RepID=A0ACC1AVE5_9ROSI|nr:hypothetical protein Patl1_14617 [Pistacia atlantica]
MEIHVKKVPMVYFYRRPPQPASDRSDFFDSSLLKEALSKALVAFYPLAGRLKQVVLLEEDFTPSLKMKQLVPAIDYSTRRYLFSSTASVTAFHPSIDRTILHARIPSHPTFNHSEYHPPPPMDILESQSSPRPTSMAKFRLSLDQINSFRAKLKNEDGATYSTFVILAAHIWRCVCKARGLPGSQLTKLHIPTEGRARLDPPLPLGYFGKCGIYCYTNGLGK